MISLPPPSYDSQVLAPINPEAYSQSSHLLLPSAEQPSGRNEAPPTYSQREVEGGTPGPTKYPGNRVLFSLMLAHCVLQFFAKFGILVTWIIVTWIYQNTVETRVVTIVTCAYGILMMNVWLLGMAFLYRQHMTIARYKPSYFLWTAYPYLFILDNIALIEVPLIGLKHNLIFDIPLQAGVVLTVLNTLSFYIASHHELVAYNPLMNDDKCTLLSENKVTTRESSFQIIDSSSFKITLNVLSPVQNKMFSVTRKTTKPNSNAKGPKNVVSRYSFQFVVNAVSPVGTNITLIPETHDLPGAIKIKDFRSFGWNTMNEVCTRIYGIDRHGRKIRFAELKQKYRVRQ